MKKILLVSFIFYASYLPAQFSPEIKTKFDQLIDTRFNPGEPGGTALIAQKGKVLYERGFGIANLELNVKMQPDMLFSIGSQTKQFTAVCILQLMEQGKLALTDTIGKYIAGSPSSWQTVTIEHLLTHSSGIADIPDPRTRTVPETIEAAKKQPLSYVPGTATFYANIEFVLLGAIVEKVSGETYGNYLKAHVLTPLGLTHTYYADNTGIIPGRVPAYLKRSSGFSNVVSSIPASGAGALVSNTYDIWQWYEALAAGKLLKKGTLASAWQPYILTDGKPTQFGYGWKTGGKVQGSPIVEHGGVAIGYTTEAFYMPQEQIFIAIFLNQRSYADATAQELAAMLIGKPYPSKALAIPVKELAAFTGKYVDSTGQERTISLINGKPHYHGTWKIEMIFYKKDEFYFDNTLMTGVVRRDAQGKITGLELWDRRYMEEGSRWWKKVGD